MAESRGRPLASVPPPSPGAGPGARVRPLSVARAASDGSRRDLLVAMRSRVATAVEDPKTPARDLAALTRRLMEIAKDIEAIDTAAEQEARDAQSSPDEAWDDSAI